MDGWTPGRRISTLYRRCQRHLDRRFEAEGIPAGHGFLGDAFGVAPDAHATKAPSPYV